MRYYETLYIINPTVSDEDYKDIVTKFNSLVEKNKGVIIKVDEWGKKHLAYNVKKFDKGYYVLLQYCGEHDTISELERNIKLDERALKYQTIKLSDDADPDALKAQSADAREEVAEEPETADGAPSEKDGEIYKEQERENGVQ